ncbi:MAG: hypothetical protein Fur0022_27610 [Anaerolineales bacterium]
MWINRTWIFALADGRPALDWGEGLAQHLLSGEFICYLPEEYGHLLDDDELTALVAVGRVAEFNATQVAISAWPPR